jgi:hypothetical protein
MSGDRALWTPCSSLWTTPEFESLKAQGLLVGDDIVISQVIYESLKHEIAEELCEMDIPGPLFRHCFVKIEYANYLISTIKCQLILN